MARGTLLATLLERLRLLAKPPVHTGRDTRTNEPRTAPLRLPRPPITMAVSNDSDRLSVKPLGDVTDTQYANSDPASPAHAALTTNASTCVRATSMPDSRAATSLSRTMRKRLPVALRTRFASTKNVTTPAARVIHANHCSGEKLPRKVGGAGGGTVNPWLPPKTPAKCEGTWGSATASARVAPAGYGPRSLAPATPTIAPAIPVVATEATSMRMSGRSACQVSNTDVVYAPIIISAPWPSET